MQSSMLWILFVILTLLGFLVIGIGILRLKKGKFRVYILKDSYIVDKKTDPERFKTGVILAFVVGIIWVIFGIILSFLIYTMGY